MYAKHVYMVSQRHLKPICAHRLHHTSATLPHYLYLADL